MSLSVGRWELYKFASKPHHWKLMAYVSIFDRGKAFVKSSSKMIGEQHKIKGITQAETTCHKRDL